MSAAAAAASRTAARTAGGRTKPGGHPALLRDKNRLPIPHVKLLVRETHLSRLEEHYHRSLADNLMYMTYKHELGPRPPPRQIRLTYDPEDPYTKNRVNPPVGGSRLGKKPAPPSGPNNVVQVKAIQLHCMMKESLTSKSNLLGAIMAFRALSGETENGGGRPNSEGVQIVRGKKVVGGFKMRPGVPCGVKVTIKGPKMYDFLASLTEFVLPRMREYGGVELPPASQTMNSPSAVSGVLSFGLPPEAMGLFPQTEVNLDAYPSSLGMHIHVITSATGVGASNRARALVSGLQVPFHRKGSL